MTDPVIIERSDLQHIVDRAINTTLTELGIKRRMLVPFMSQNQASKLVGETRLKKAIEQGLVEWYKKDPGKKLGRVYVSRKDVQKLLNNPIL